jgi:hypothetical protein
VLKPSAAGKGLLSVICIFQTDKPQMIKLRHDFLVALRLQVIAIERPVAYVAS